MSKQQLPEIFQQNGKAHPTMESEILSAKAAEALADLTDMYQTQVANDIEIMTQMLVSAKTLDGFDRLNQIRTDFFNKIHDLKGQGRTFGYPLLTELGAFACDYLRHKTAITDEDLAVLDRVLVDIRLVHQNHMTGDNPPKAQTIRRHIKRAFHG